MTAVAVPARESRAARTRLVLILGGLTAFAPLSIDMYLPGLPQLARELHASATSVQLTLTACLVGLALGQLVAGPLSDRLGRRRPLLVGVAAYALASLACAAAPSIATLTVLRLVQGAAGAAGIVIARAVVRDLHAGNAAVKFLAALMLVTGLAPILAPVFGGQLLEVTSWRGIFLVLAGIGVVLLAAAGFGLRETLPEERRRDGGVVATLRTVRMLLTDRRFACHALAGGLGFGALFVYVSGSPFVVQDLYGGSAQLFSVVFATNSIGIVIASQVGRRLVDSVGSARLLRAALTAMAVAGAAALAVVLIGGLGLVGLLLPFFVLVSCIGIVMPNAMAIALQDHPEVAGTASALAGVVQFAMGAGVAPLASVAGTQTALPMTLVMAGLPLVALAVLRLPRRARARALAR